MASESPAKPKWITRVFAALLGSFLGLCLLKFGNPPIMERWVAPPKDAYEFVLSTPWPASWAYGLLAVLAVVGLLAGFRKVDRKWWIVALPLVWLAWQLLASSFSVDPELTRATVKHFVVCLVCFYLGLFCLGARPSPEFWLGILCGFTLMLAIGWEQRFGGLEESRRYFYIYIYPNLKDGVPPEYLKKISSNRIFASMFYPNALAGALLLCLPVMLVFLWQSAASRLTNAARGFVVGCVAIGALGCLFWSGSKGGWLLMLFLGLIVLLRLPVPRQLRVAVMVLALIFGLAGFFWKYSGFFKKGATSVSARFDYWRAALRTAGKNPLFGTGPGTFAIPYQKIKDPESEMARLVHNDYLEQASDSGWPGFVFYLCFVGSALLASFPRGSPVDWLTFAAWLGVLGWALQSFLEFSLYIPALAWPAFTFLGWLLAKTRNEIDNTPASK